MTGRSKMNEIEERLPDMTLKGILLDVSVSPKKKRLKMMRYNKHLILFRFIT